MPGVYQEALWIASPFSGAPLNTIGFQFGSVNRQFKFEKRRQLFIRVHNETLSVAPMRVRNPDRSPATIHC
jgi:hypothetical protein